MDSMMERSVRQTLLLLLLLTLIPSATTSTIGSHEAVVGGHPTGLADLNSRSGGVPTAVQQGRAVVSLPHQRHRRLHHRVSDIGQQQSGAVDNVKDISSCSTQAALGHCDFYTCLSDEYSCNGAVHKTVGQRMCQASRHPQPTHILDDQTTTWVRQINRCILMDLSSQDAPRRDTWCQDAEGVVRAAFVRCAQSHQDLCDLLISSKQSLRKLFPRGSWLTLVEAAQSCPRRSVNSYILWQIMAK